MTMALLLNTRATLGIIYKGTRHGRVVAMEELALEYGLVYILVVYVSGY